MVHALLVSDGLPVSTSQIVTEWSHVERRLIGKRNGREDRRNYTRSVRRACEQLCVRAGYANTIGNPILWRLRPDVSETV